jgi:hypothetical protein
MSGGFMRNSNTKCCFCNKAIYRRPNEIQSKKNIFCSQICFNKNKGVLEEKKCESCSVFFKPDKKTSKFCSRACANYGRKGSKYSKESKGNKSRRRLDILKSKFSFEKCMIEGCEYNKTYDIHRLIKGKDGGKYEVGNMFAICPNHHAEIHRGLIEVEKIDDKTLKIFF